LTNIHGVAFLFTIRITCILLNKLTTYLRLWKPQRNVKCPLLKGQRGWQSIYRHKLETMFGKESPFGIGATLKTKTMNT